MPIPTTRVLFGTSLALALFLSPPPQSQAGESGSASVTVLAAAADEVSPRARARRSNSPFGDYLAGLVANSRRDLSVAADLMLRALEQDPDDTDLHRLTFLLTAADGRHAEAARLARMVLKSRPDDIAAILVLSIDSIERGDLAAATDLLASLPDRGLGKIGTPLINGWVKFEQGQLDQGLALIATVGEINGFGVMATLHTALVRDLADHPAEAEAAYRSALDQTTQPSLRLVWLFGNFLERNGRPDQAIELYREFQDQNRALDVLDQAVVRSRSGIVPPRETADFKAGIAEVLFSLATLFNQERAEEMALIQAHMALRLRPRFEMVRILLGEILESQDRGDEAITVYREIDPASPLAWSARLRAAEQLDQMGRTDEAIAELDVLAEVQSENFEPHFRKGNLLRAQERFEEAVTAYDAAFQRLGHVKKRHWSMLYFRGIALERSGEWDRAEADFLKALELEQEQPYVMNYLAYSWVEKKLHLDRAQQMLVRAVELRPNDGFIVDSLGWVFYRLGAFEDAVGYLERAVELRPQDPVINDHLGDAFWRVGRYREARFQWRRAISLEPETDQVPIIDAKIKDGLEAQPEKI